MNPPFNDPARQNVSPDPQRRLAHALAGGHAPALGCAALPDCSRRPAR